MPEERDDAGLHSEQIRAIRAIREIRVQGLAVALAVAVAAAAALRAGAVTAGAGLDFAPMILRRITGVLVTLLLFHLTSVGDVSACADRIDHGADATVAGAAHAHHGPTQETESPVPSPDGPVVDRCCAAMASCAVVLIATDGSGRVPISDDGRHVRAVIGRAPTSGPVAPEPPPPKA